MNNIRIGVIQLNTKDNIEESFGEIEKYAEECAGKGADLIVLPELSTYLSENGVLDIAEDMGGSIIRRFKQIAEKFGVYLHNGSFAEKSGKEGKAYNTSVLINPEGGIVGVYRKIHLFDVDLSGGLSYRESDRYLPGSKAVVCDTDIGKLGFTICYDLRFPELFRNLAVRGAELIFVPAAFTLMTGKDHWEPLLRARAIENQVYIVAANQFGKHPEDKSCYGNSMIVDPWGKVIARASDKPGCIVADIDWSYLVGVRSRIPSLKNMTEFS